MRKSLIVFLVAALALGLVIYGCGKKDKGKFEEIEVTETTTTTPVTTTETIPDTIPEAPVYEPKKLDVIDQLYEVLGSSEKTLGWDNVYCSISLEKSISLFEILAPAYKDGTANNTMCKDSMATLGNINTSLNGIIDGGKTLDPNGADAEKWRKDIRSIRMKVDALRAAAPAPEPIPEWKGDLMKAKWKERGDMMKKKWAER